MGSLLASLRVATMEMASVIAETSPAACHQLSPAGLGRRMMAIPANPMARGNQALFGIRSPSHIQSTKGTIRGAL